MSNILKDQINLQQLGSHTYTSSWHHEWTVGPTLHGGHVAAAIQLAAQTHLMTTLAAQNQPDILNLHFDFLLACVPQEMTITVFDIKVGKGTCSLQLQLTQKNQLKVVATAISTNFSQSVGPTARTGWAFHPPPNPAPKFEKVLAHLPDDNWLPAILDGEILSFTRRQLLLNPRGGFNIPGICDAWYTFPEERMDATYLTMMTDCIPAMSDTLLHNQGPYDAHMHFKLVEAWAEKNPGVPAPLKNSLEDAARATLFDVTLTLDIEFKRRLPKGGQEWIFSRAATRMMQDGRLDLEVTLCDQDMELLCLSRQTIMALDAQRKFGSVKEAKPKASL